VSAHRPAFLTLRDTNVLNPALDEADDNSVDAMRVILNDCRPALRAVRSLTVSQFGEELKSTEGQAPKNIIQ
jgi:hypothetical protein